MEIEVSPELAAVVDEGVFIAMQQIHPFYVRMIRKALADGYTPEDIERMLCKYIADRHLVRCIRHVSDHLVREGMKG